MENAVGFVYRPTCELCGATQVERLLSKPYSDPALQDFLARYYQGRVDEAALTGAVYEIARCQRCGFIWQVYILNNAGMQQLYGHWIASEDSLHKKEAVGYQSYLRQAEVIGLLFPPKPRADIQVLDFGMGWGYWCVAAQACGYQVVGLEISEARVRFAQNKGVEVIGEIGERRFDFINAEQVFEHVSQPLETLISLVKCLYPGGVVRIGVPNGAGMERAVQRSDWHPAKNALHPLEHVNCFDRRTLIRLGEAAGLRVFHPPPLLTRKYGAQALIKGVAGNVYRRFFNTTLYFQKRA